MKEVGERLRIYDGLKKGCVMLPWLFILFYYIFFTDGVLREMKTFVGKIGD